MKLAATLVLVLVGATLNAQDPKAEQLRNLHAKFQDKVSVLSWKTRSNMRGMQIESDGSATAVIVGDKGLVLVSAQPFAANPADLLGRGGASAPEDFKIAMGDKQLASEAVTTDDGANVRWFKAEGATGGVKFPEKVDVPAIGEEVVIIGAFDATLNFARFFRTARVNAVVEDGKCYGLDGAIQDCLGALVVTCKGDVIGIVGQRPAKSDDTGGIGRLLGGLNDPAKVMGNRVLLTPAVFAASAKKAAGETTTVAAPAGDFQGAVASATWREGAKDHFVLIDLKGGTPPAIDSKVAVKTASGETLCELVISRHYTDGGTVNQIGGPVADPDKKLKIEKGMAVVAAAAPAWEGFRGVDRFLKMDKELLDTNYGGKAAAGFRLSQRPQENSPAAKAGLQNGDVVIKVGDKAVTAEMTLQDFTKLLKEQQGEVKLTILRRGGEQHEIKVP